MLKLIPFTFYHLSKYKLFIIAYILILPLIIGISIYVTNNQTTSLYIGVVGDIEVYENEEVDYVYLDSVPNNSELALNEYDAVLVQDKQDIKVVSTKGKDFNQAVLALTYGQIDTLQTDDNQMYFASAIIGFLMLSVMNIGVQMYLPYFDERKGINKRILSTSITSTQYMLSYFFVIFSVIFIPAALMVSGAILLLGINILMPLWQLLLILSLFSIFTAGFGLWISSLCKTYEQIGASATMISVVCAIVSGSIVPITDNQLFNNIVQVVPQKHVMAILDALEKQLTLPYISILYVIGLSLLFVIFAIHIEKKRLSTR
jgi:ABC-2 type transport system permease protein